MSGRSIVGLEELVSVESMGSRRRMAMYRVGTEVLRVMTLSRPVKPNN